MNVVWLGSENKEQLEKRLQIVATAGALSKSSGTVTEVFESHNSYEKNLKLIKTILGYGHKSTIEHNYLVFALENVTPIVEQIIIGYRLTSFTIKSRRNVDFRNVGFYIPNFKDKDGKILKNNEYLQEKYKIYMQSLFDKYGKLVDMEIPIEDCRYILPYSYYSNIIMGCDANEFFGMVSDMLYGEISKITEVHELGEKFADMIKKYVPYLEEELKKEEQKNYYDDKFEFLDNLVKEENLNTKLLDKVEMTDYSPLADHKVLVSTLMARYQCSYEEGEKLLLKLSRLDSDIENKMISALVRSKHQRELEQVIFSYQIPISLAALTHITRHRMQSLIIPEFTSFNLEQYITPVTIAKENKEEYDNIYINNKIMREYFLSKGAIPDDLIYFLLSGNACNIITTLNARTLEWISRMRCCNKAQWEIRGIVNQMVELASSCAPLIGETLGASCKVLNKCSEGKDSCKNRGVVIKKIIK